MTAIQRKAKLERVKFYAKHKIIFPNKNGRLNEADWLVEPNSEDILLTAEELLRERLNVCFYGHGSLVRALRDSIVKQLNKTHLVFELLGFANKTVFRNLVAKLYSVVIHERLLERLDKEDSFRKNIVNSRRPKLGFCFDFLIALVKVLREYINNDLLFVIYKLDRVLEREPDFLKMFLELYETSCVKLLFTVESFQSFWQMADPFVLNRLHVNYFSMHTFEVQTFELESLELNFKTDSSENKFYSFVSLFSGLNSENRLFLYLILKEYHQQGKRLLSNSEVEKLVRKKMLLYSQPQIQQFLKEPLSHNVFEQTSKTLKINYTSDTLKRILIKMRQLDEGIKNLEAEDKNFLDEEEDDEEDSEEEEERGRKAKRSRSRKKRGKGKQSASRKRRGKSRADPKSEEEESAYSAGSNGEEETSESESEPEGNIEHLIYQYNEQQCQVISPDLYDPSW